MSRFSSLHIMAILAICILSSGVIAGEYHWGQTLKCSDCHATHASQTHDDQGNAGTGASTANPKLLKYADSTTICLSCHDDKPGIPDVMGTNANNPGEIYDGSERAAGQFPEGTEDSWKGHNLSEEQGAGHGGCIACHDPHGNPYYRNLRLGDNSDSGIAAYVNPSASGLDRYQRVNIGYVQDIGEKLCGRCHDIASPDSMISGEGGRYHRHPSSSSGLVTAIGSGGDRVDIGHWVSGLGSGFQSDERPISRVPFAVRSATDYSSATAVSADNEVFCLSCHKAHGSTYTFSMVWAYGTGEAVASNSGCNQCHNIAGT